MSDAIFLAYPHLRDATVLIGMPDTIVDPPDSLSQLHHELRRSGADIALAIAPTAEPARLGPVNVDRSGRVREIFDKPEHPPHNMVWTVACWNWRFTEYLHNHLATNARVQREAPLGLIFQSASQDGFQIQALSFPNGRYIDAGTLEGLQAARHFIAGAATER
jgi:glucose-1-phosphate thymidylyltransferase